MPKRLQLSAFSNAGQVKTFVERFPTEFRLASLGKIILPCCKEGMPFMTPDGKLPCPLLSTCNALKFLQGSPATLLAGGPKVVQDIERVFDQGLQVEWREFEDYLAFMIYYEGAAVQGDIVIKPSLVDTTLLFLGFFAHPSVAVHCKCRA